MRIDFAVKYKIVERIKTLIVIRNNTPTYADCWTDTRLAKEFHVSPAQIRSVRTQIFPDMVAPRGGNGPGRPNKLKGVVDVLEAKVEEQAATIAKLANKVVTLETNFALLRNAA